MHILMIFLDGVGLGENDPTINPFAYSDFPTLTTLTNGKRWLNSTGKQVTARGVFIPTDPRMGVAGRPQSATGQATIITGKNIPAMIGRHYGPKPNEKIRDYLDKDNIFKTLSKHSKTAALLEAYPPPWHKGIQSGKSLPASYQYAIRSAGYPFMTKADLIAGNALSGDWTGAGWRDQLGHNDIPVRSAYEAGKHLVQLSRNYDFALMSHWLTDVVGHRGPLERGVELLQDFDEVMRGVLDSWDDNEGLVIMTSDHGNIEAIHDRRHTENDVPSLVIGNGKDSFTDSLTDLTDFVPRILSALI